MRTADVLGYPIRGPDSTARFLVVAVLSGLPAVVCTLLVVGLALNGSLSALRLTGVGRLFVVLQLLTSIYWLGYFVGILKDTYAGRDTPPAYDEWGRILRDGGAGLLIGFAYVLPAAAIAIGYFILPFTLFGSGAVLSSVTGVDALSLASPTALVFSPVGILSGMGLYLLVFLLLVLVFYVVPISLCGFADEGSLTGAFDRRRIGAVALHEHYLVASAILFVVVAGLAIVSYVVSFLVLALSLVIAGGPSPGGYGSVVLCIGLLFVPMVSVLLFYVGVAAFRVFGRAYVDAVGTAA